MKKRMNAIRGLVLGAMMCGSWQIGIAQTTTESKVGAVRDGQHDFDWEMGTWKIHVSRLMHPLEGANDWTEFDGTVVARKVWDGRANLAEIELDGKTGHIEFLALRLYNPKSHQWNINFANAKSGTLNVPAVGGFNNGRGEFYDQEEFNGKMILVRFVFNNVSHDSGTSEQAYSEDGGKTWETNWKNTYTRVKGAE